VPTASDISSIINYIEEFKTAFVGLMSETPSSPEAKKFVQNVALTAGNLLTAKESWIRSGNDEWKGKAVTDLVSQSTDSALSAATFMDTAAGRSPLLVENEELSMRTYYP
jgi:hypothetical protein